jgi:hypothetical protein
MSNNKSDWIEIDRRNGSQEMSRRGLVTFSIADVHRHHIPARFVRLTSLSGDFKNELYLMTYFLDVYGSLIEFHEYTGMIVQLLFSTGPSTVLIRHRPSWNAS